MKSNRTIRALACSALLAFTTLSAQAQTATDTTPSNTNRMSETYRNDNTTNYSWIGLFGLAGLAGLLRRKEDLHVNEPQRVRHA